MVTSFTIHSLNLDKFIDSAIPSDENLTFSPTLGQAVANGFFRKIIPHPDYTDFVCFQKAARYDTHLEKIFEKTHTIIKSSDHLGNGSRIAFRKDRFTQIGPIIDSESNELLISRFRDNRTGVIIAVASAHLTQAVAPAENPLALKSDIQFLGCDTTNADNCHQSRIESIAKKIFGFSESKSPFHSVLFVNIERKYKPAYCKMMLSHCVRGYQQYDHWDFKSDCINPIAGPKTVMFRISWWKRISLACSRLWRLVFREQVFAQKGPSKTVSWA